MGNNLFNDYLEFAEMLGERQSKLCGIELEDALQEARILLFECSQTFDETKGMFTHYLSAAMTRHFRRLRFETAEIYVPYYKANTIVKAKNVIRKNLSGDEAVMRLAGNASIKRAEARETLIQAQTICELEDSDSDAQNVFSESVNVEAIYIRKELREEILKVIRKYCTEREADILALHFGFYVGGNDSEIAEKYGVSKQRICQLRKHGLEKLNEPRVKFELRGICSGTI